MIPPVSSQGLKRAVDHEPCGLSQEMKENKKGDGGGGRRGLRDRVHAPCLGMVFTAKISPIEWKQSGLLFCYHDICFKEWLWG